MTKVPLLAAEHPTVAVPDVDEPVPELIPTAAAPSEARDFPGSVGVPPAREYEDDLAAEDGRDLVLVREEELAVLLSEVGTHLLGAGDHRTARDAVLALPEEGEDLVSAAADRDLGREGGRLHLGPAPNDRQNLGEQVALGHLLHVGVGPAVAAEGHRQFVRLSCRHRELVSHDTFLSLQLVVRGDLLRLWPEPIPSLLLMVINHQKKAMKFALK